MKNNKMLPVKPVLVTGSPRSGTTWVGRMLTTSSQFYYVHEPFNPGFRPGCGICNIKFNRHQTYITEENEKKYYQPIKQMIEGKYNLPAAILACRGINEVKKKWRQNKEFLRYRRLRMFPLIKDPIALMSAGWLGRRFDINVIVMIRHPGAFAASMKRLNWGFDPSKWALSQPLLLRDYLSPLEEELRQLKDSKTDIVGQTALLWKILYFVVSKYKEEYPHWIYLRHEDISRDPLVQFEKLFGTLGLNFTDEVRGKILEYSNESNPSHSTGVDKLLKLNSKKVISHWKNVLPIQEVKRIKSIVEDVSKYYYSDGDWEL
jgi:Sulfotransferase family